MNEVFEACGSAEESAEPTAVQKGGSEESAEPAAVHCSTE
jgi:hypothetical protein